MELVHATGCPNVTWHHCIDGLVRADAAQKAGETGRKTFEPAKAPKRLELATIHCHEPTPPNII
jgi:hypothetical protein